jgi:hypothetical protein
MATVDVNAKNANFGRSAKRGLDREAGQSFFHVSCREPERLWGVCLAATVSTNRLRAQANRFLDLALKAHDKGQLTDAHQFTVKAAELLEAAVSLEELRKAVSRVPTSSLPSRNSRSTKSGARLDDGG